MKKNKITETLSTQEISRMAENEGLGYMIMYLLSPEQIEDEKLAGLVKTAQEAINEIADMLKRNTKVEPGASNERQA